jgi:hypothetical protein
MALEAGTRKEGTMMANYQTMTVNGGRGSDYEAVTDDEATAMAEADGYTVLDVTELGASGQLVLVIAD